jgi:hypothetical protein
MDCITAINYKPTCRGSLNVSSALGCWVASVQKTVVNFGILFLVVCVQSIPSWLSLKKIFFFYFSVMWATSTTAFGGALYFSLVFLWFFHVLFTFLFRVLFLRIFGWNNKLKNTRERKRKKLKLRGKVSRELRGREINLKISCSQENLMRNSHQLSSQEWFLALWSDLSTSKRYHTFGEWLSAKMGLDNTWFF